MPEFILSKKQQDQVATKIVNTLGKEHPFFRRFSRIIEEDDRSLVEKVRQHFIDELKTTLYYTLINDKHVTPVSTELYKMGMDDVMTETTVIDFYQASLEKELINEAEISYQSNYDKICDLFDIESVAASAATKFNERINRRLEYGKIGKVDCCITTDMRKANIEQKKYYELSKQRQAESLNNMVFEYFVTQNVNKNNNLGNAKTTENVNKNNKLGNEKTTAKACCEQFVQQLIEFLEPYQLTADQYGKIGNSFLHNIGDHCSEEFKDLFGAPANVLDEANSWKLTNYFLSHSAIKDVICKKIATVIAVNLEVSTDEQQRIFKNAYKGLRILVKHAAMVHYKVNELDDQTPIKEKSLKEIKQTLGQLPEVVNFVVLNSYNQDQIRLLADQLAKVHAKGRNLSLKDIENLHDNEGYYFPAAVYELMESLAYSNTYPEFFYGRANNALKMADSRLKTQYYDHMNNNNLEVSGHQWPFKVNKSREHHKPEPLGVAIEPSLLGDDNKPYGLNFEPSYQGLITYVKKYYKRFKPENILTNGQWNGEIRLNYDSDSDSYFSISDDESVDENLDQTNEQAIEAQQLANRQAEKFVSLLSHYLKHFPFQLSRLACINVNKNLPICMIKAQTVNQFSEDLTAVINLSLIGLLEDVKAKLRVDNPFDQLVEKIDYILDEENSFIEDLCEEVIETIRDEHHQPVKPLVNEAFDNFDRLVNWCQQAAVAQVENVENLIAELDGITGTARMPEGVVTGQGHQPIERFVDITGLG